VKVMVEEMVLSRVSRSDSAASTLWSLVWRLWSELLEVNSGYVRLTCHLKKLTVDLRAVHEPDERQSVMLKLEECRHRSFYIGAAYACRNMTYVG